LVSRHAASAKFNPIDLDGTEVPDYVGMADWYCQNVLDGRVPACTLEELACRRFLAMRKEALSGRGEFGWSDAHVYDVCSFVELLPHTLAFEGPITLEPVQCWWLAGIFGFRERETGLRWVRDASFWIPRKNGKTLLAAGIVLFCACGEEEPGAQVVISAGSEKQAKVPFKTITRMLELEPDLAREFGARATTDFVNFVKSDAEILLVATRAKNLDGLNPHLVLAEELHAQAQDVIGVLRTAQGSRRNPLFLAISTSGRDINAPGYDDWKMSKSVLEGRISAPRMFTAMYAADEEDEKHRFSKAVIEKLNPLWGQALNQTSLETEITEAKKSESKLQEYKRTRLNIWSRAAGNLLSVDAWDRCGDNRLKLETLKGYKLYVGIDLASRSDLNAASYLVDFDETLYTTADYWLCEEAQRLQDDRFADAFFGWARDGWLTLTPGGFIDYKVILAKILERLDGHDVVGVALDDYQANLMASEIEAAGYQTYIVRKNAKSLTPATEDLIARHRDPKLFQHDANPVTAWCAGNVVGYWDANENVLPKKEKKDSRANIDGVDALILANAIRIDNRAGVLGLPDRIKQKPNPYLERGLAGYAA
jgi:phage terminase large subunit-like protein